MNIFIDTNILLDFYHLSNADLEELRKLIALHEHEKIVIIIPDQVVNEFKRNRDSKISDALSRYEETKIISRIPQIVMYYEEYNELKSTIKDFNRLKKIIHNKVHDDIENNNLQADSLINELFKKVSIIKTKKNILARAKRRCIIGNPPGKNNSHGDAINWEILIEYIEDGEDLYFISDDKDYKSALDSSKFNNFLIEEWENKKESSIYFYTKISDFLLEHFPDIKLADDLQKSLLINELRETWSFASTHSIISKLNGISSFSKSQANQILTYYVNNSQIYWIICDEDIKGFILKIISDHKDDLDKDKLDEIYELLERC